MSVTRIATRYAKSLLDLAIEQDQVAQVHADIKTLAEAVKNRDLYLMLKSPIIKNDMKNAALAALFGSSMSKLTMLYLKLLVEKNREMYLPEIAAEFVEQYKTLQKITSVKVITATPLSDAVLNDLKLRLQKSGITHANLDVQTAIDEDLIGGFVLEFDNKRYDASVASKLVDLKNDFSKNLYVKEY
ncbi:MAG: ATP synthase F1 subunit delta [Saprospiraceae bacterium]|nr:ATP synthase F1 subunit delta [Saprospiraceae bacterium]